jgi:hypothetical protein
MGYDITLILLSEIANIENKDEMLLYNVISKLPEQESTYLSYNFSKFKNIWYACDSFGKTSEEFANDLRTASQKLTNMNIIAEIPKELQKFETIHGEIKMMPFDGWTPDIRVFYYHIKRLLKICEDNPHCIVIADIEHSIYVTIDEILSFSNVVRPVRNTETFITYYRHPIKGNMKVDTFEKACEIAQIAKKMNDTMYIHWEELAWQLPGAPSIK